MTKILFLQLRNLSDFLIVVSTIIIGIRCLNLRNENQLFSFLFSNFLVCLATGKPCTTQEIEITIQLDATGPGRVKVSFSSFERKKEQKKDLLFFVFMLCNQIQSNMLNMSPELLASSVNSVAWGTWMGFR